MPRSAPKPCKHTGCGVLVLDGTMRCASHKTVPGSFSDRRRGSRHERGYGTEWDKIRKRILQRDAGLCQTCLRKGYTTTARIVDHIKAKAEGGTDDEANLEVICQADHDLKTAREALRARGVSKGF